MRKVVVLGGQSEGYAYEIAALSCFSDVEFVVFPSTKKEDALAVVQDAEVILFTATKIDAELIDKMEKCKLIIRQRLLATHFKKVFEPLRCVTCSKYCNDKDR